MDFTRRTTIQKRLAAGEKPAEIAADLGVALTTIYRARGKQGRRKGDAAGYTSVAARVSEREAVALDRLVRGQFGRSRGAVLRKLIRIAGGFYSSRSDEEAFLFGAEQHLSRLGGNFNQIAAALSASVRKIGRADPTRDQIATMHRAADDIVEIRLILRQMLENSQRRAEALRASLEGAGAGEAVRDD